MVCCLGGRGSSRETLGKPVSSLRLRQWQPTSSCPDHLQGRWFNREGRIQPAVNSCNIWPGALQSQSPSQLWSGDDSRDLKPMAALSIIYPGPQVCKTSAFPALLLVAQVDFPAPWSQTSLVRKACSAGHRQWVQAIAGFEMHEKEREGAADSEPVASGNPWRSSSLAASYRITGKNCLISL